MHRSWISSLFVLAILAAFAPVPSHAALSCRATCTFGSCSCWFCSCGCSGSGDPYCGSRQAVAAHVSMNTLSEINPFEGAGDGEVDRSSIKIERSTSYGELSVKDGIFIYVPEKDFTGLDSFTLSACNFEKECDLATVLIDVQPK